MTVLGDLWQNHQGHKDFPDKPPRSQTMPPDQELQRRVPRKLTKKRTAQRAPTVEIPEKFKDGADAQEDAAACRGQQVQYMNQSVFSMIAAAGSKVDFHSRFDDGSSDSDDDSRQPATVPEADQRIPERAPSEHLGDAQQAVSTKSSAFKHRRKLSEHKLLRSLPKLNLRTPKEKDGPPIRDQTTTTEASSPGDNSQDVTPRDAPVMSRMLEAEAQAQSHLSARHSIRNRDMGAIMEDNESERIHTSLAVRLMEIFGYEKPEEVISGRS